MQRAQNWKDTGECRPEFGNLFPWIQQVCWSWLERCLYTQLPVPNPLSRLSPRAKLFRGLPLGPWSRDHEKLHNTRNMAADSHPDPGRTHHNVSHTSPSASSHQKTAFPCSPSCRSSGRQALSSSLPSSSNCSPAQETTANSSLQSQARRRLPGRDLPCFDWQVTWRVWLASETRVEETPPIGL